MVSVAESAGRKVVQQSDDLTPVCQPNKSTAERLEISPAVKVLFMIVLGVGVITPHRNNFHFMFLLFS